MCGCVYVRRLANEYVFTHVYAYVWNGMDMYVWSYVRVKLWASVRGAGCAWSVEVVTMPVFARVYGRVYAGRMRVRE